MSCFGEDNSSSSHAKIVDNKLLTLGSKSTKNIEEKLE